MRISNSFSEDEIKVMNFILETLLRGGDASMARRSKDFPSLMRKAQHMKKKAEEMRGGPLAPLADAATEGSGIVVRADEEEPPSEGSQVDAE